jgi:hypothetical protein
MRTLATIALAVAALSAATAAPAAANLACNGPFQFVDGRQIATPFCEDNYLARVARSYGMRVSNQAIRWNASVKSEACRLVGHDNRVRTICAGEMNQYFRDGGRRR